MRKILLLIIAVSPFLSAQDSTVNTVVRKPRLYPYIIVRESNVTARLWEGFTLVRNANSGDAAAQHELAIRYLVGQGFPADTSKAFSLIYEAAKKGYMMAHYNLGVFYSNGWGVEWNPFEAYNHFKIAANSGMLEGLYAFGLIYTDNLIVKQDWNIAYRYVKRAAEKNFKPALEIIDELSARAFADSADTFTTSGNQIKQTISTPIFLDFSEDSVRPANDAELMNDIIRELPFRKTLKDSLDKSPSKIFELLLQHAEYGIPEEWTVIGRFYETGNGVKKDSMKAAAAYMRALRLESRRAPALLSRMLRKQEFVSTIERQAKLGNSDALYLYGCLALTGRNLFSREQAYQSLQKAAEKKHLAAMNELGLGYLNGQIFQRDISKAVEIWSVSANEGSNEALVRLAAARLLVNIPGISIDSAFSILKFADLEGSIIAQFTFGLCYENGIGKEKKTAEAVRYYRNAAQRGSVAAYESLKRLYNSLRPNEKEFFIPEQM